MSINTQDLGNELFSTGLLRRTSNSFLRAVCRHAKINMNTVEGGKQRRMRKRELVMHIAKEWSNAAYRRKLDVMLMSYALAAKERPYDVPADAKSIICDIAKEKAQAQPEPTQAPEPRATQTIEMSDDQVESIRREIRNELDSLATDVSMKSLEAAKRSVAEYLESVSVPQKIVVENKRSTKSIDVGVQHKMFKVVMQWIAAGERNIYLYGPAASGKTEIARAVSKAMDLPFYPRPVGKGTTKSDIFGFNDAHGKYNTSIVRKGYDAKLKGGVICVDEFDRINDRIGVMMNMMIDNNLCEFGDANVVHRHENAIVICTGNTAGFGADRQYTTAVQQDASLTNRFVSIKIDYDEDFERALAVSTAVSKANGTMKADEAKTIAVDWVGYVHRVREFVSEHRMRYLISPRQSLKGVAGLVAGIDRADVEAHVLFACWNESDVRKVKEVI